MIEMTKGKSNPAKASERAGGRRTIGILIALCTAAALVGGAIWLVASGQATAAVDTVIGWGEDGTMDRVEAWVLEELFPMGARILGGAGALLAMVAPLLKKLKDAKQKLDEGTAEAVATYGERNQMQAEMKAFMKEQRLAMDQLRREQMAALAEMMAEQRASLAADRAATKRIEGKVDGLRRMEEVAHTSSAELVKLGAATRITEICRQTEGEGGADHETDGDDEQAAEDAETA
jgi:BMFP domain-containing protein YqiC